VEVRLAAAGVLGLCPRVLPAVLARFADLDEDAAVAR
jgi:hypothetical protein